MHFTVFYADDFLFFLHHPNNLKNKTNLNVFNTYLSFYGYVVNNWYWHKSESLTKIITKKGIKNAHESQRIFVILALSSTVNAPLLHRRFMTMLPDPWNCLFLLMHMLTNIDLLCPPCTKWVNGNALWIKCLGGGVCFVPIFCLFFSNYINSMFCCF